MIVLEFCRLQRQRRVNLSVKKGYQMLDLIKEYWNIIMTVYAGVTGVAFMYLKLNFVTKKEYAEVQGKASERIAKLEEQSHEFVTETKFEKLTAGILGELHTRMDGMEKRMVDLNENVKVQLDDLKKMLLEFIKAKMNDKN